eukprot:916659_1
MALLTLLCALIIIGLLTYEDCTVSCSIIHPCADFIINCACVLPCIMDQAPSFGGSHTCVLSTTYKVKWLKFQRNNLEYNLKLAKHRSAEKVIICKNVHLFVRQQTAEIK